MKTRAKSKTPTISVVLFEDSSVHDLAPISLLRPVFDIKTGACTLRQKAERTFNVSISRTFSRQSLTTPDGYSGDGQETATESFTTPTLFVNGSVICDSKFAKQCKDLKINTALVSQDRILAMFLDAKTIANHLEYLEEQLVDVEYSPDIDFIPCNARMLRYPWDAIRYHDEELASDLGAMMARKRATNQRYAGATLIKKERITIGAGTRLYPNVVLNAEKGDVVIGKHCELYPHTYIEGPCYIGDAVTVKPNTSIRGSSIGEHCKVGGEISSSIFHAFVNKQHEGFAGNSYFAPWVNLGAGTVTSNLKNNYSAVKVRNGKKEIDTGMQFLGTIAGDHVKFGINTMLNTGTIVGVGCNIFGGDFPPKMIASFQWGGAKGFERYDLEKFLTLARTTMARRNETLSIEAEHALRSLYKETATPRKRTAS